VPSYYDVDGKPLGERKLWLQDDYVKFIRWAQWRIEQTGAGILAFISNHGYLDNPTFRGMREKLLKTFSEIYLLNLHGNVKKREKVPEEVQKELGIGEQDENVFDIQQGVAIGIFIKEVGKSSPASVYYHDLWGLRELKYQWLLTRDISNIEWQLLNPSSPFYFFVPRLEIERMEYETLFPITSIFQAWSTGVQTSRDAFAIAESKEALEERIQEFIATTISDEYLKEAYNLKDMPFWKLHEARQEFRLIKNPYEYIKTISYRPFDNRNIIYHKIVIHRLKLRIMRHMLHGSNIGLLLPRQLAGGAFRHAFCTKHLAEMCVISTRTKEQNNLFPLYLYPTEAEKAAGVAQRKANLNPDFTAELSERLGLDFVPDGRGDLEQTFGPEDAFHYIYAVLHSPTYRERYKEFLKIDFPRIPLTSDLDLFRALCQKGADLVALHLLEPDYKAASWHQDKSKLNPFHDLQVRYPVPGDDIVEKGHPKYVPPGERAPGACRRRCGSSTWVATKSARSGSRTAAGGSSRTMTESTTRRLSWL